MNAFEWDPFKAEANFGKHKISFASAATTLLGLTLTRPAALDGENRFTALGVLDGRTIVVVWTPRANFVRIISARRAGRREREAYRQAVESAGREGRSN
ncbi:MAG: BrnT family toxin [Caulobacteraceae bacterium]|nr:BrnT family toxin [Caulobacteraceae bacterium]